MEDPAAEKSLSVTKMECREKCGACCIIPSISSPMPGYPSGKAAGEICHHLSADFRCMLFELSSRPRVCAGFKPEKIICGNNREEAILTLTWLEGLDIKDIEL
jgi:uncharacterized protein